MNYLRSTLLIGLTIAVLGTFATAQETATRVVDEVVAVVNDSVITLSRIKSVKKDLADSYVKEGKTAEEAKRLVDEKEGELIANLINEELLIQKAKEVGLDSSIEADINARFVQIMKDNNLKTIDALYQMMRSQGFEPDDIKENWRSQATRDKVIQELVQKKVFWESTPKELKDYFDAHKEKFIKPETVSYSEIYLGFAGRDEAAVRAKAKEVYDELKKGANFDELAKANSDPGIVTEGAGKAEKVSVSTLTDVIKKPIAGIKPGDFTLPFEVQKMGIVILRIDAREAAGSESTFDENAVRLAILQEKGPAAQKKFMTDLRTDAYIKINDTYRPIVSPLLYADERKETKGSH
ncbi:MAG TPA: peptidyl-prolyl cis-trans isomerase [Pyrinomonadaceae bacterium]|nr:peptidyl-prolyl cis-trans isomerase [Pyrinomonadaceae bacterium]